MKLLPTNITLFTPVLVTFAQNYSGQQFQEIIWPYSKNESNISNPVWEPQKGEGGDLLTIRKTPEWSFKGHTVTDLYFVLVMKCEPSFMIFNTKVTAERSHTNKSYCFRFSFIFFNFFVKFSDFTFTTNMSHFISYRVVTSLFLLQSVRLSV